MDRGAYFRIPADTRSLNYGLYFDEGDPQRRPLTSYDSHTTTRLVVKGFRLIDRGQATIV
ncbi:MAG: UDP-N-acetylglucosamine 4,6-dehydratase/5-epimerase [Pseudonocardiales bacterium]|jgi:UDP-N-acetylglucosamine 4,6-dehydratase|nr:UDP-N-acetylglucosamine 4,6-dehydratase/5-epimerase [Pseudonocardiales bacterium]